MSEKINPKNHESIDENFNEKLKNRLDSLSSKVPEIAETREVIEIGGKSLIEEFGLKSEFFDDETRCLFFMALAQRNGSLINSIESDKTIDTTAQEKEFIYDAMALVALDKSENYDQFANLIDNAEKTTGEYDRAVYDKYTNKEVTEKMKELIGNGLLSGVQFRLGVTQENEDHYELRVLNVGNDFSYAEMRPRQSEVANGNQKPGEYEKSYEDFANYRDSLKQTTQSFANEAKMVDDELPLAWNKKIDGIKTLVLPLPVAEMIINPEGKIKGDKDRAMEEIISVIEHEYVHTQGGLNLDGDSLVGIALEELRAEYYSGNKQGYQECKSAANYIYIATGFNLIDEMDKSIKGGDCDTFFEGISNRLGLQQALELSLSYPNEYVKESSQLITRVNEHLGGLNGFVARLCENDRFKERSDRRFNEFAGIEGSSGSLEGAIDYYKYEASKNRMPYAAGKIINLLQA